MGKGGGSAPQPTTQTVQQSNIPEYARPYFEDIMTRGTTASNVEYQPYQGQRVAEFTPMQQQAFQNIENLGVSPLVQQGAGLTGLGANLALQSGQYQPMAPQQTFQTPQFQGMGLEYLQTQAPQLQQFQMGPAERARTGSFAMPGTAERYMSPYMQNVVDIQQREAQRQADIAKTQRGAQAVGAGAFGGSRQAIMEAEAARNLATQKGDIQAQGLQSAFQQAQQAYQTDAARQLQAQLANQQAGLTTGQQNLQALLQTQGLGAQTGMQAQQLNQAAQLQAQQQALGQSQAQNLFNQQNAQLAAQYGLAGLQAAEQSRQFGANLGQQGVQQLLGAAGQLGQLGQTQFGQELGAAQAQQQTGALQQAQAQQQKDLAYEEFMRQQLYPQSQLQFLSSLLRGSVVAPQQTMYSYQAQPSMVSQLGGLGLGALGLSKAFAKDGGEIKRYADGGITGGEGAKEAVPFDLSVKRVKYAAMKGADPRQLVATNDPLAVYVALQDPKVIKAMEMRGAAKRQQDLDQGSPQGPSVLESKLAERLAGLETLDAGRMADDVFTAAGGGVVAFEDGGGIIAPQNIRYESSTPSATPFGRMFDDFNMARRQNIEAEYLRRELMKKYGPKAGLGGLFTAQSDEERALAKGILSRADEMGLAELRDFAKNPEGYMGKGKTRPVGAAAQDAVQDMQEGPAARAMIPAAQAGAGAGAGAQQTIPAATMRMTPGQSPKADEEDTSKFNKKALMDPDARVAEYRKMMAEKFPSQAKEREQYWKDEGAKAAEELTADRWLAVAMGGFAAAAGQSQYALQNFAQGLGLTTKEMIASNKEFRKAQDLRNKAMREEQKADRLEQMGLEDKAYRIRLEQEKLNLEADKAEKTFAASMARTQAYRDATASHERIAGTQARESAAIRKDLQSERLDQQRQLREASIRQAIDKSPELQGYASALQSRYEKLLKPGISRSDAEKIQAQIRQLEQQRQRVFDAAVARTGLGPQAGAGGGLTAEQQALLDRYLTK